MNKTRCWGKINYPILMQQNIVNSTLLIRIHMHYSDLIPKVSFISSWVVLHQCVCKCVSSHLKKEISVTVAFG